MDNTDLTLEIRSYDDEARKHHHDHRPILRARRFRDFPYEEPPINPQSIKEL
ncbi:hypothetical protein [Marinobacter sp. SS21]|uniref:hypothetical protein n=1 Tax=Marinobacter sp. SS21 TaxID=2979460 RepID=UPI00232FB271|nr:hypothetical protein [Marinobacter sp. SS21]MDC0662509.1 hypothetical protein [Marinobacter sp. SS21]